MTSSDIESPGRDRFDRHVPGSSAYCMAPLLLLIALVQGGCGRIGFALLCAEGQTGAECRQKDGGAGAMDAGTETPMDAGTETPMDAGNGTPMDTGTGTPMDAGTAGKNRVVSLSLDACNSMDDVQGLVGTPTGALTAATDRHGVVGGACRFPRGSFITVPYHPSFASPHFSVSVWVSVDWAQQAPNWYGAVYMWRSADPLGGHNLFTRNEPPYGTFEVYLMPDPPNPEGNPWNNVLPESGPAPAGWMHAAVTYDGAYAVLYVDGQERSRKASTYSFAHTQALTIGAGDGYEYAGSIDDFTMFNRALTPSEVLALSLQ